MACEDTINWGPWLQDGVSITLTQKGMAFTIRADRAGRYVTVYREDNLSLIHIYNVYTGCVYY